MKLQDRFRNVKKILRKERVLAEAAVFETVLVGAGLSDGARRLVVRTGLALFCLLVACNVPFLALLMSLIGSLFTIGTAILLPVAIHSKIFKVGPPARLRDPSPGSVGK